MSERHQVKLVKIEIFRVSPASPVNLSPASPKPVTQGVCDSTSCLRQTAWRREGSITSPTAPPLKWCRINKWRHINKQCLVTNRRYITNARPVTGGCLVSIGRRITKRCYQTAPSPCGATSPMAAVFPLATESRNGVTKRRYQTTSRHVRPPCH